MNFLNGKKVTAAEDTQQVYPEFSFGQGETSTSCPRHVHVLFESTWSEFNMRYPKYTFREKADAVLQGPFVESSSARAIFPLVQP